MSATTTAPVDGGEDPGATVTARGEGGTSWLRYLSFQRISAVYVLILLMVIFAIWVPDTFLTWGTFKSVLGDQSVTALLAIGLVIPLAAGAFDLSVGLALGAGNINVMYLMISHGWSMGPAIALSLVFGLLVGAVNGGLVAGARLDSFIATLGVNSVLSAYVVWVSSNQQIVGNPLSSFGELAGRQVLGIGLSFWIMLVVAIVVWYVLTYRPAGRRLYATGGSADAARLAGVRTRAVVCCALLASGVIAAAAGVLLASRIGVGSPTVGAPYMIPAFAAVFLGSTQLASGRFNVWGTVLAVYVLAIGVKGLQLAGAPFYVSDLFNGIALISAVWLSRVERGRSLRTRLRARGGVSTEPAAS
jgi:ribose transport system permease protein